MADSSISAARWCWSPAATAASGWGDPDDFAGIAAYLASDASSFHTGDTIVIDGGYTVY